MLFITNHFITHEQYILDEFKGDLIFYGEGGQNFFMGSKGVPGIFGAKPLNFCISQCYMSVDVVL